MSSACSGYQTAAGAFVRGFTCPRTGGERAAAFCCGFSDRKYCCEDAHSFFPHEYAYMWWLSLGALLGLLVAGLVLLAFLLTLVVLCCLFITNTPRGPDPGLPLTGVPAPPPRGEAAPPPQDSAPPPSVSPVLDGGSRPDPERLLQRCFTASSIQVEAPV